MDIEILLKTKPYNHHYLNRYIKFIKACSIQSSDGVMVKHHICPKASDLFPEYDNLIENQWNCILLSDRQHFIAHWMLWKSYGGSQQYAFWMMSNFRSNKLNSKTYGILREETRIKLSVSQKGKPKSEEFKENLSNYMKGKRMSDESIRKSALTRKGQKRSDQTKKKMSLAQKGKPKSEEFKENLRGREGPNKNKFGEKHHSYGKKRSDQTKKRISDSLKVSAKIPDNTNKVWINDGSLNKRVYDHIYKSEYSHWNLGMIKGRKL